MSDYKETTVSGTQWQRCGAVVILNPHGGSPSVRLDEEVVATVGADTYVKSVGSLNFPFDPAMVIDLRNPQTGELIGATTTGLDVYTALYSLYIQKTQERDTA